MLRISPLALTLPLLLVGSPTLAQSWGNSYITPVEKSRDVAPRAIVVEPDHLQVNLQLDRYGSNPVYRPGESITLRINASQNAYIYIFSLEADGSVKQIFPNPFVNGALYLQAGEVTTLPTPGSGYRFKITPPYGQAQVLVLASQQPLNRQALFTFQQQMTPVYSQNSGYWTAPRAIVVEKDSPSVATATASYRVIGQ
jgi:hypothetical protein